MSTGILHVMSCKIYYVYLYVQLVQTILLQKKYFVCNIILKVGNVGFQVPNFIHKFSVVNCMYAHLTYINTCACAMPCS